MNGRALHGGLFRLVPAAIGVLMLLGADPGTAGPTEHLDDGGVADVGLQAEQGLSLPGRRRFRGAGGGTAPASLASMVGFGALVMLQGGSSAGRAA
ncbi:hypothetical protein ACFY4K_30110 [Streptomyces leeuwenhoekii]|uniref:hypothetical protein n=1 Tax=Streptomyces leeuwenhoekii TaxID=1437453 RepID=UPI0036A4082C